MILLQIPLNSTYPLNIQQTPQIPYIDPGLIWTCPNSRVPNYIDIVLYKTEWRAVKTVTNVLGCVLEPS